MSAYEVQGLLLNHDTDMVFDHTDIVVAENAEDALNEYADCVHLLWDNATVLEAVAIDVTPGSLVE